MGWLDGAYVPRYAALDPETRWLESEWGLEPRGIESEDGMRVDRAGPHRNPPPADPAPSRAAAWRGPCGSCVLCGQPAKEARRFCDPAGRRRIGVLCSECIGRTQNWYL